jgi:hypothetical protein
MYKPSTKARVMTFDLWFELKDLIFGANRLRHV